MQTESPMSEILPTTSEFDTTTTTTEATLGTAASDSLLDILQDTLLAVVPLASVACFIAGALLGVAVTLCMMPAKKSAKKSKFSLIQEESSTTGGDSSMQRAV